jgi:hypothetical protein
MAQQEATYSVPHATLSSWPHRVTKERRVDHKLWPNHVQVTCLCKNCSNKDQGTQLE